MANITYVALRDIEATGYSKGGTDISVAAADDSYNSVSTNLLGLSTGEWALVAGYANTVNNGWFHASGNSTAAKIIQDTTTSLTTEAAGPAVTILGYKRGLNQTYSVDFNLEMADRASKAKRTSHQPLGGGRPEVLFFHSDVLLHVRTGVILEANIKQWREFLSSVQGGELFTLDRYGTAASPVESKNCILTTEEYTEAREGTLYPGRYRISFDVQVLNP